jgi:dihydropteroate synthase
MKTYKLSACSDFKKLYEQIGTDKAGIEILNKKSYLNHIFIKDLKVGAANILKQDAISVGADLVVPRGTIVAQDPIVDAVLLATDRQLLALSKKEMGQPFGLKAIAQELTHYIHKEKRATQIMGVVNANDDSFFSGSRFLGSNAVEKIEQMITDGADIVDLGGVSTRPGSEAVSVEEELSRVKPIIETIYHEKLYEQTVFSIDSYTPKVIDFALNHGFKIVNDITGLEQNEVAELTASYNATIVMMHMQGKPQTMQENPSYEHILMDMDKFFQERIAKAESYGIKEIILDVGIGFGKTLEHNLALLNHLENFKKFGYEILIGASRKSLIDKIVLCDVSERLPGTLAIHLDALSKGASIVRCHDVKEHYQAVKVHEAIQTALP